MRSRKPGFGSAGPMSARVENLRAWLTTVVARVCLDMLRTRTSRREDPLDVHVPDPVITRADAESGVR